MKLNIEIDTKRVLAAIIKAPEAFTREVRREMKSEMAAVQEYAVGHHKFTSISGNLDKSIKTEVTQSGFLGTTYLSDRIAKYGKYVHSGTGIYGKRKRPIRPKRGKFLKFTGKDGRDVFVKEVKGQKADPFLYRSFGRRKQKIVDNLNRAIQRGFKKAGL